MTEFETIGMCILVVVYGCVFYMAGKARFYASGSTQKSTQKSQAVKSFLFGVKSKHQSL